MDTVAVGLPMLLIAFFFLGILAFAAAAIGFWVWMLVDCAVHTPPENNQKLVWVLVIVFTGWLGALIYCFAQRPRNRQAEGYRP